MFKLITPYSFHDRGLEHQRFILFRLKNISIYVLNKKLKSALENSNLLNSRGNITKKNDLISPPTPTSMIIITWNPLPPEKILDPRMKKIGSATMVGSLNCPQLCVRKQPIQVS